MASTPAQEIQEVVLSTASKGQEIVVEAVKTWVNTLQAFTPELPSFQVPYADYLPKPGDVVVNAYEFAAQVLASQRKFAEELLKVTAPLLPDYAKAAPAAPIVSVAK
jgi:hypothetical protein